MKTWALMVVAVPADEMGKCKFPDSAYRMSTELSLLDNETWMLAAAEQIDKARIGFALGGINLGTVH